MIETENDQKELAQKALRQIRALCQGNGVAPDSVQIKSARGTVVDCQALTHIELYPNITNETKKGRVAAGQLVKDPGEIQKITNDILMRAIGNDETRKFLAKMLLDRADKGFALHAEYFDVAPLGQTFCYYEPCSNCGGAGQISCRTCGGQRREVCNQCHGRSMVACNFCRGSGFMQGANGKQTQCTHCHGQRQIACRTCGRTGSISCRNCKGTGAARCEPCSGSGHYTQITHLNVQMKTLFEIDRAALPDPVVKIFEKNGSGMAEKGHIRLQAEQVKREDGGLAIQYIARFPYGDLEVSINGKALKTHIFGYKGKLLNLPSFLDQLVAPQIDLLEKAVIGDGSVTANIKKASKARFVAHGLLLSVSYPANKAMVGLKSKFPMGASNALIKQTIILSNKALANATRKTRLAALALGVIFAGALNGIYFLGPLRALAGNQIIADLALLPIGAFVCAVMVKYMSQRPLKQILLPLLPPAQQKTFKPKKIAGWYTAYILGALCYLGAVVATKFIGTPPDWLPF